MAAIRSLISATLVSCAVVVGAFTAAPAGAVVVQNCVSSHLSVRAGAPQGTAGTSYYPLIFTNHGPACALWGVPQVQPVVGGRGHSRAPVGPAARNASMGEMPARLIVGTAHAVSDAFGVVESSNYPANGCRARTAFAVLVSLAPFVAPTLVPLKISVCTRRASTTTRLLSLGAGGVGAPPRAG